MAKYNSAAFVDGLWLNAALRANGEYEATCYAEDDDRVLGGVLCDTLEDAKREAIPGAYPLAEVRAIVNELNAKL